MPTYQRNIFEKEFIRAKAKLAKATGNFHTDTYTTKSLEPGGSWDFDHIISAKAFTELPNAFLLPNDVQARILSSPENIAVTDRAINKSKNKHDLLEWLTLKSNGRAITNAEFYKIDVLSALKVYQIALNFLTSQIENELTQNKITQPSN